MMFIFPWSDFKLIDQAVILIARINILWLADLTYCLHTTINARKASLIPLLNTCFADVGDKTIIIRTVLNLELAKQIAAGVIKWVDGDKGEIAYLVV